MVHLKLSFLLLLNEFLPGKSLQLDNYWTRIKLHYRATNVLKKLFLPQMFQRIFLHDFTYEQ